MQFIFRTLSRQAQHDHHHLQTQHRTLVDTTIKWVRDRGLDHAVEKEKNLLPVVNIKNFIKSEPSKSIPISLIAQNRECLKIPIRPIDFVRKHPSVFEEFFPGNIGIHPHIRLTSKVLDLDAEEQLIYQSEDYKQQTADRLLKLLMLLRVNKIPLTIIDRLRWDLGLPQDYVQTIVPEFPDYFQVANDKKMLELVCWSNELAISVMEKKVGNRDSNNSNGMPIAFPMKFSKGFEMDKKFKKWVGEFQKLPYFSPYEDASHILPKSEESDKWAVSVLHELLYLLFPKKTQKENILCIGEYFGLRSRFKRAILNHPGIFYLSSKIGTYTVVLKEGYKRGSLIQKHPLLTLRNEYIHLINSGKEDSKAQSKPSRSSEENKHLMLKVKERKKKKLKMKKMNQSWKEDYSSDLEVGVRKNVARNWVRTSRRMNTDSRRERQDRKYVRKMKERALSKPLIKKFQGKMVVNLIQVVVHGEDQMFKGRVGH